MSSILLVLLPALATGVGAGAVAAWFTYRATSRVTSGTVATSPAEQLWAELRADRDDTRSQLKLMAEELRLAREENYELREQMGLLRIELERVRGRLEEDQAQRAEDRAERKVQRDKDARAQKVADARGRKRRNP